MLKVCAALLLVAFWAPASTAPAFTFTPGVTVKLGYDDNVRLRKNPRADWFTTISPNFSIRSGQAGKVLDIQANIDYTQYYRLNEETGLDGGQFNLGFSWEPSPQWRWDFSNRFSSTYDAPEYDERGAVVRIRETGTRQDRNVTRVGFTHEYGEERTIGAAYSLGYNSNTDETQEKSMVHRVKVTAKHRFNPDWRGEMDLGFFHDDYEKSADNNQYRASALMAYLIGPSKEVLLSLNFQEVKADSDDPSVRQARDYQTLNASLGFAHEYSPTFKWEANLGWSRTEGDQRSNQAAGKGFPTGRLRINYTAQRWNLMLYTQADLGEYDVLGENAGLTYSQRAGGSFNYDIAPLWSLSLQADYIRDNYKQDFLSADTTERGDVDSIILGAVLNWRLSRDISLGLDYRYLNRDSTKDNDDREQNRVMLILTAKTPRRW